MVSSTTRAATASSSRSSRSSSSSPVISMRRSRSNSRPITAAALSARPAASGRCSTRRPITCFTPSGTPSDSSVNPPPAFAAPISCTWLQISRTKNGLPSVSRRMLRTNSASGAKAQATRHSRPTSPSSRPESSISSTEWSRRNSVISARSGWSSATSSERNVPRTRSRAGSRLRARWDSNASVGRSAQCRSSSTISTGAEAHSVPSRSLTASNMR